MKTPYFMDDSLSLDRWLVASWCAEDACSFCATGFLQSLAFVPRHSLPLHRRSGGQALRISPQRRKDAEKYWCFSLSFEPPLCLSALVVNYLALTFAASSAVGDASPDADRIVGLRNVSYSVLSAESLHSALSAVNLAVSSCNPIQHPKPGGHQRQVEPIVGHERIARALDLRKKRGGALPGQHFTHLLTQ